MYLEEKEKDRTSFHAIKKLHEVNNHKVVDQLISAYRKAGWMSPEVSKIMKVLYGCRVSQKFVKLVSRLIITLPKSSPFNEVVTFDLKSCGSKYML